MTGTVSSMLLSLVVVVVVVTFAISRVATVGAETTAFEYRYQSQQQSKNLSLLWTMPVEALADSRVKLNASQDHLLQLDNQTTRYYLETPNELDEMGVDFDEYLYRSLKSIRHSVYVHLYDYKYSNRELMKASINEHHVDTEQCTLELNLLAQITRYLKQYKQHQSSIGNGILTNDNNTAAMIHRELPLSTLDFIDSFGKPGSGLLSGNFRWFGSIEACTRSKLSLSSLKNVLKDNPFILDNESKLSETMNGRYCVNMLRAKKWPKWDVHFGDKIGIKQAVCLPQSCHSITIEDSDEQMKLVDEISRSQLGYPFDDGNKYEVSETYCLPDEESEHRTMKLSGKLFVCCAAIWLTLLITGNVLYETKFITNNQLSDLIASFSLKRNLNYLLAARKTSKQSKSKRVLLSTQNNDGHNDGDNDNEDDDEHSKEEDAVEKEVKVSSSKKYITEKHESHNRVDIEVLDGIKVICTIHIIYSHVLAIFYGTIIQMRFSGERMLEFGIILGVNGLQSVNMFYIITAALVVYLSFTRGKPASGRFWIVVLIGRYIRLVPPYFIIYWFVKSVVQYTGNGPFFLDYRTNMDDFRSKCSEEPWENLWLLKAADVKLPEHCIPPAWYLSNDFRTLFILPIFGILLKRNVKIAYMVILATFIGSLSSFLNMANAATFDWHLMLYWKPHNIAVMVERMHVLYTTMSVRLSSYMLGIVVGHLLYLYKTKYIKQWPYWFRQYAIKLALLNLTSCFLLPYIMKSPLVYQFLPDPETVSSETITFILPFAKTWMEASMGVIMLSLATGGGSKLVRKFFSSQVIKLVASVSYLIFLVHAEILIKFSRPPQSALWSTAFMLTSAGVTISFVVALILHLLYEMPINNLIRIMFKKILASNTVSEFDKQQDSKQQQQQQTSTATISSIQKQRQTIVERNTYKVQANIAKQKLSCNRSMDSNNQPKRQLHQLEPRNKK